MDGSLTNTWKHSGRIIEPHILNFIMEHLPASDADAIAESLHMVDEADIYLGIFALRYGYIPKGYNISITEMEFNRAVERGIPRLIFLMHEDHANRDQFARIELGLQMLGQIFHLIIHKTENLDDDNLRLS